MIRTKLVVVALFLVALTVGPLASQASAVGPPNIMRTRFTENACTFIVTARWRHLDFVPDVMHTSLYEAGVLVAEDTLFLGPTDAVAATTLVRPAGSTSEFYAVVSLERLFDTATVNSQQTDTIVANCD